MAKAKAMYVLSERDMADGGELEVLPKMYKSVKAAKKAAFKLRNFKIDWDDDEEDNGYCGGNSPGATASGTAGHWEYSIWAVK
jgi:hypothetical protein